jgi:hypothetical protein
VIYQHVGERRSGKGMGYRRQGGPVLASIVLDFLFGRLANIIRMSRTLGWCLPPQYPLFCFSAWFTRPIFGFWCRELKDGQGVDPGKCCVCLLDAQITKVGHNGAGSTGIYKRLLGPVLLSLINQLTWRSKRSQRCYQELCHAKTRLRSALRFLHFKF